ncbi:MAG: hypothetical protein K2N58_01635 [Treponemataceae bacterium]|nr:hypothetical protein [Treponemataceae bacterium]
MALPILMTSFFKTRLFTAIFHCVAKWRFSATPESEDSLVAEKIWRILGE